MDAPLHRVLIAAFGVVLLPRRERAVVSSTEIGIEVCPISNQVLKLVADLRNHPLVTFAGLGLPATLSPDDPALWGAVGSSHDWTMAFFALGETAGLAMLKQLAMNSLALSALGPDDKAANMLTWTASWNSFVDALAADADADSAIASCGTNLDCSLNGVCGGGVCNCDKPWTGPSCGRLAYNKTTPKSGQSLFPINRTHNTWNGPIMGPTPDGKFHLFAPCERISAPVQSPTTWLSRCAFFATHPVPCGKHVVSPARAHSPLRTPSPPHTHTHPHTLSQRCSV